MRPTKKPHRSRGARFLGYAIMAGVSSVCLGLLGFFGVVYAIYADIKEPQRSHLVAGTGADVIAYWLYTWYFRPIWQADARCVIYDPQLVYVPKPGVVRFSGPEFETTITMTAEGLRQQPPAEVRPGGPVVIAGDSFAMGWGVNDAETFSAVLATRYHHPTVNTGVSSYGTARELLRLRRLGLLRDASLIVIQFCENDDGENEEFLRDPQAMQSSRRTGQLWGGTQWHDFSPVSYGAVLSATVHYLRDRTNGRGWLRALNAARRSRRPAFGTTVEMRGRQPIADVAARFLAVWDSFPELAGKPVIVTEMNPNAGDDGFLRELQKLVRERPNFRIVQLSLQPEDVYRFDHHLNARGNEAVAAQLDREIRAHAAALSPAARPRVNP